MGGIVVEFSIEGFTIRGRSISSLPVLKNALCTRDLGWVSADVGMTRGHNSRRKQSLLAGNVKSFLYSPITPSSWDESPTLLCFVHFRSWAMAGTKAWSTGCLWVQSLDWAFWASTAPWKIPYCVPFLNYCRARRWWILSTSNARSESTKHHCANYTHRSSWNRQSFT